MDFHSGPLDPGSPDGDPRFGDSEPFLSGGGDTSEDGPFRPWLPPEDRLWRHPSEGTPRSGGETRAGSGRGSGGGLTRVQALASAGATGWRSTCVIAVIAGLVGAAAMSGVGMAGGWWHRDTVYKPLLQSTVSSANASAGDQNGWIQVDDLVAASVVSLTVAGASGVQQGSGVLLFTGADGASYVVTDLGLVYPSIEANYVGKISVAFLSGGTAPGRLIGWDRESQVAVIEAYAPEHGEAATTGTVASLSDAAPVMAMGARSLSSLAMGEVTGQDRTVNLADGTDVDNLIAVSMPTAPSPIAGGPIVDQQGDVVGVTLQLQDVDPADQQFTYAEPIDEVNAVVSEIIEDRSLTHPWLGVTDAEDMPDSTMQQLGISAGVKVGAVTDGSPAARAGIQPGDILTSFDGTAMTSAGQFVATLAKCTPGVSARVAWFHDGAIIHSRVVLGAEPADAP